MEKSISKTDRSVKWESPYADYRTTFKSLFYARKSAQVKTSLYELFYDVSKSWLPRDFEQGRVGVHTTLQVIGPDGKKYLWPCLDIEHPKKHGSRADNIRVAQSFFLALVEAGLAADLQIVLTGRGFRFCWPYLIPQALIKAFKLFCADQGCIDSSTLKPSSFTRHLAYFGNNKERSQHKTPYDGHSHMLNKPEYILGLDEGFYVELIQGTVTHHQAVQWLSQILPAKPLPPEWHEVLQPYVDEIKLQNAIIKFPRLPVSSATSNSALKQAFEYLDRLGIAYTADETAFGNIYRLSKCPECPRTDANPYLTESGRLKHWTKSCPAGSERNDDDRPVGLNPNKWIPDFQESFYTPEGEPEYSGITIDEARHRIEQAVRGNDDLLIIATPGIGKTTSSLIGLSDHVKTQKILMAEPTNIKADEVYGEALKWLPGANIYRITGRNKENCIRFQQTKSIAEQGFSPGNLICPMCRKRLERRGESCPYFEQFKQTGPGLYITSHEQSKYLDADTLIVDEDGWQAFQKEKYFTLGELYSFVDRFQQFSPEPEKLRNIIERIHQAAANCLLTLQAGTEKKQKYEPTVSVLFNQQPENLRASATIAEIAELTRADIDELLRFTAFFDQLSDETPYQWQRRLYSGIWGDQQFYKRGTLNLTVLNWLKVLAGEMSGGCTIEIHRDEKEAFRFCRQWSSLPKIEGRYILLDGTGDKADSDRLFGRDFQLLDIQIPLKNCEFHHIRRACGKRKSLWMDQLTIRKLFEEAAALLRPTDRKVLIATHMGSKAKFEKKVGEIASVVMPDRKLGTIHFCGTRGLNLYKDYDACILFGSFTKNLLAAWKRAVILYPDKAGQARCIKAQSTAENLQTVHRIRPINGGKNIVVIARDWIPGLPNPETYNQRRGAGAVPEVEQGYLRLKKFYESFGFVSKGIGWNLGVGCKRDFGFLDGYSRSLQRFLGQELTPKFCCILPNIINLLHRIQQKTGVNNLVLGSPNYWNSYIKRLKADFPEGGTLETTQDSSGTRPGKGFGSVVAARRFYEGLGLGDFFESDKWQQITPHQLPEASIYSRSKTEIEGGPYDPAAPAKNHGIKIQSLPAEHLEGVHGYPHQSDNNGHSGDSSPSKRQQPVGLSACKELSGAGERKNSLATHC